MHEKLPSIKSLTSRETAKNVMPIEEASRLILVAQRLIKESKQKKRIWLHIDALVIELSILAELKRREICDLKKKTAW